MTDRIVELIGNSLPSSAGNIVEKRILAKNILNILKL